MEHTGFRAFAGIRSAGVSPRHFTFLPHVDETVSPVPTGVRLSGFTRVDGSLRTT